MWIIANINQFELFKKSIKKTVQSNTEIYFPKINFKNNSKIFKNLLGNYIFCFNKNFNSNNIRTLKYTKGLNYFLENSLLNQKEIKTFVKFCKSFEDKRGVLMSSFFLSITTKKYEFLNGPLKNILFKIRDIKKNKIFAETMNKKIVFKKENSIHFLSK
tara:strand:+ start:860 stop:1336 length:477 start_codon:yes stop_codon:yes gene_type:complete